MSADNGIYILQTEGPQFRVSYQFAIDNLCWDDKKKTSSSDPDVMIENARKIFKNATVFNNKDEAFLFALDEASNIPFLEYGVSFISIPRKF